MKIAENIKQVLSMASLFQKNLCLLVSVAIVGAMSSTMSCENDAIDQNRSGFSLNYASNECFTLWDLNGIPIAIARNSGIAGLTDITRFVQDGDNVLHISSKLLPDGRIVFADVSGEIIRTLNNGIGPTVLKLDWESDPLLGEKSTVPSKLEQAFNVEVVHQWEWERSDVNPSFEEADRDAISSQIDQFYNALQKMDSENIKQLLNIAYLDQSKITGKTVDELNEEFLDQIRKAIRQSDSKIILRNQVALEFIQSSQGVLVMVDRREDNNWIFCAKGADGGMPYALQTLVFVKIDGHWKIVD